MSYLPLQFEDSEIFPQKIISIRPDVHIMLSSGTFSKGTKRESGTTSPVFELSYSRKNTMRGEVNHQHVELQPGHTSLGFLGEATGHSEYQSGEEVQLYSIWVSPDAFNGFCEDVGGRSNVDFASFQKGSYYHCDFRSDAREESIKKRVEACFDKKSGHLNRLLVESCILELLSINLEKLLCTNEQQYNLTRTDIERLMHAREILLNRLDSPPSLLELSRFIQMNDCKLKRSFKQYFGLTVYGFIRDQRLENAFSLLEQGKHNVSETAFAVGYTNVSHFSQAFQRKFEITPGTMI